MIRYGSKQTISLFVMLLQMIFPWMFDEIHVLKPFKDVANILANKEDWPPLYDIAALKNNKVLFCRFYLNNLSRVTTSIRVTSRRLC